MKLWARVRCLVFLTHGREPPLCTGVNQCGARTTQWLNTSSSKQVTCKAGVNGITHFQLPHNTFLHMQNEPLFQPRDWCSCSPCHTFIITRLTALCPGLPGWAGTRKVKPIWILMEQETVSGSGISWAICKSAPRSRQITTPAPHHSVFLQAGCPSCRPTNSVKALKAHVLFINAKCRTAASSNYTLMSSQ